MNKRQNVADATQISGSRCQAAVHTNPKDFPRWIEVQLDLLEKRFADFVTPKSKLRNLKQSRS